MNYPSQLQVLRDLLTEIKTNDTSDYQSVTFTYTAISGQTLNRLQALIDHLQERADEADLIFNT